MAATELVLQRPRISVERARQVLREVYGIEGGLEPLPGYADLNFRVEAAGGKVFVLKFSGALEERTALEAQNEALRRLLDRGITVQQVVVDREGREIGRALDEEGRPHFVRLLTYLPGVPLASVSPKRPPLLRSLGTHLARLTQALSGFDHPGAHREELWDLARTGDVVRERLHLLDSEQRALVEHFLARFELDVEPRLGTLRHSVVYGDANDHNVLVNGRENPEREVKAVIDFGDLVYSVTVAEIAIGATYVMLDAADPLSAASHVVSGFHELYRLHDDEIAALYPLITMRLCASVCLSAENARHVPGDAYVSVSREPAWRLLGRLKEIHPRLAEYALRAACGLEPCERASLVESWVERHHGTFKPVLDVSEAVAVDFSVESRDWSFEELARPGLAGEELFHRLQGRTGFGGYGEARLVYGGPQFAEGTERRTIHIGIDLFRKEGSAVCAPLGGIVHSFADNDRPFDYGPTIILKHAPAGGPVFYTLYGHLSRESLAGLTEGMEVHAGEPFASIGAAEENGGWAPHLHFQLITDMLGHDGDFPGVAAPGVKHIWMSICPDPSTLLGLPKTEKRAIRLAEKRAELIGPSLSVSYRRPIELGRANGQFLYDREGRAYLDTVNNVAHVGHCHARVAEAASRAMRVLNTNTRYHYRALVEYAERLTATLPAPLRVCYFVNSGSEANDLALRLARAYTGRKDVVVLDHAYHGNLTSLIEISPYKFNGPGGEGKPPHTHVAAIPDPYRGLHRGEGCGANYVAELEKAFLRAGSRPAAFIAESVLSCGGQVFMPEGFLEGAYRTARAHGAVCIADEVQTGFGRVGDAFWAFEPQGVVPDVVTMGKPIGNGHPLGAVVTTREIASAFDNGMEYFNTYGGNPVSCAVGLAVLDVLRDEDLQAHASAVGSSFIESLRQLSDRHEVVGDVRGSGLFIGVELVRNRADLTPASQETRYIIERMKEEGVLASLDGPYHNVLKIKPPMVFDRESVDRYVSTLDLILAEDFVGARLS